MRYRHGGELLKAAKQASLTPEKIIDFSVSVNPRQLSKETTDAIVKAADALDAYPDATHTGLKSALAKHHGTGSKNILPGNGSTELIYLIAPAVALNRLPGHTPCKLPQEKKALIVEPAFSEYRRALEVNRFNITSHTLSNDFRLNADTLLQEAVKGGYDLLFIANPANPTGVLTTTEQILLLANGLEGGKTVLVLDEAFIDFVDGASIIKEVAALKNSILLRSLTKFYSLAGLRLGFIVTHAANIERIAAIQPPWSVNSIAVAAAIAAITDETFKKESITWLRAIHTELLNELNSIDGLKAYPSAANFIMVEITVPEVTAASLQQQLLEDNGILIRDLNNFYGLGSRFFRIAIKEPSKNRLLTAALKSILNTIKPATL